MDISSHRQPQATRRRRRPRLEQLEDRQAPALYTVTTLADENNGIGVGGVSLREALAVGDADTIDFAVTGTINLDSALPNLFGNLRILGPGAGKLTVRRAAAAQLGIFNVIAGADVEIAGMTIQNGHNCSGSGGGVASTNARLTLTDCVLRRSAGRVDTRDPAAARRHLDGPTLYPSSKRGTSPISWTRRSCSSRSSADGPTSDSARG